MTQRVADLPRMAGGNLEGAAALGAFVRYCPVDSATEPVDMLTMSTLVGHLRSRDRSMAVRRLTAAATACRRRRLIGAACGLVR